MSGFYARNYVFIGNGVSSNDNALNICKGCAKALIRCGWRLDSRHSSIDDIKEHGSGNNYCCWYCLVSKTKNAKLLVFYNYRNQVVPKEQMACFDGLLTSNWCQGDLCLSIIPDGSDSEFGVDPTSSEQHFVPDDATYLKGAYCDNGSICTSAAYFNSNGQQYEWTFVTDGEETVFYFRRQTNGYVSAFCVGKILETLAYPEVDTLPTAKCGLIELSLPRTNTTSYYDVKHSTNENDNSHLGLARGSFLFLPNGVRYTYPSNTSGKMCDFFAEVEPVNRYLCSSYNNGQRRWVPFGFGIFNQNTATGQVIHGSDGFKGYLDTNVFRYVGNADMANEQSLNDGSFLHFTNGIAIGWDSTNTLKLLTVNSAIDTRNWNGGVDPFGG